MAKMYEEGQRCPYCKNGFLQIKQEPCYCSACAMPPCANCESSWLECEECGWSPEDNKGDDTPNECVVKGSSPISPTTESFYFGLPMAVFPGDMVFVRGLLGYETWRVVEVEGNLDEYWNARNKDLLRPVVACKNMSESSNPGVYIMKSVPKKASRGGIVKVRLESGGKLYSYYAPNIEDIWVGSSVNVNSPISGLTQVQVVEILETDEDDSAKHRLKHIVDPWSTIELPDQQQKEWNMRKVQDLSKLSAAEILEVAKGELRDELKDVLYDILACCLKMKQDREKWVKHRQGQLKRIESIMVESVKTFDDGNFDATFAAGIRKQLSAIEEERNS